MTSPIDGVKKFSGPMFVVFVLSKVLIGIGVGVLLAAYLIPYAWPILIVGVAVSAVCLGMALKNM